MKKSMSFILVLTMLLSVFSLGVPTVGADAPLTLIGTPSDVTEQPFETPTDLLAFGDPNGDQVINAKDALIVLLVGVCKHHLTPEEELAADVNRDGLIDAQDVLEMLKHAVGKPSAIQPMEIKLQTVWPDTYTPNTPEGKAWKTHLATVEISHGIQTHVEGVPAENAVDAFVKGVMAGKIVTDVAEVSLAMSRHIARKKAAANIFDSKTLNKSLYDNGATQSVTFNGKVYGVSLSAKNTNITGIIYNKELIEKYAPGTDIQALYKEKKWTFDAFQALAKQCTVDTDGDGKTDSYGITSNTNFIGMAMSANAGGSALMKNGRVEATFCNDDGINALGWCKELFKTDRTWKYHADINDCAEVFAGGKAAMIASYARAIPTIGATADFPFGFVPMPIGPTQSQYINNVYEACVYVVSKTSVSRLEEVGFWLNGMASTSDGLLAMKRQQLAACGLDEDSCDNFETLVLSATPDFSAGAFTNMVGNMADGLLNDFPIPDNQLAAIRAGAKKELDEYYGPLLYE